MNTAPPIIKRVCGRAVIHSPMPALSEGMRKDWNHAASCYAFVVQNGETLTGEQWVERLERMFMPSPRLHALVAAIRAVMCPQQELAEA